MSKIWFSKLHFIVLTVFFFLVLIGPAEAVGWKSRGIGGGGALFSPAISPHNPQLIYVATDMSSVFKSTDFGLHWATLHFRKLQGGINSHVRFTDNPDILYAINRANDMGSPVKSIDAGNTWRPLGQDPTDNGAYFLYADPANASRLLVSDYAALYFSSDGGATFTKVYQAAPVPPTDGLLIGGVFWNDNSIFLGTSDGLLVSTNGGQSFFQSTLGGIPSDERIVSFAGAKQGSLVRFLAVTHDPNVWTDMYSPGDTISGYRAIYQLDWGQANWKKKVNGISDCARFFFVGMARNNINVAYLAGGQYDPCVTVPSVYKTSDGGDTWTNVLLTQNNQNIFTGWSGNGGDEDWWYGEAILGLAVSPADANRVAITDLGFVHVTDDGGANWRQAYVLAPYENAEGSKTPRGRTYATNGLEDTSAWWLQWFTPATLFASFSDIHGIRSTNGGKTWMSGTSLGLLENTTYQTIKHPTTGKVYAATSSLHDIYQSNKLRDRDPGGERTGLNFATGAVLVSNNNGKTWTSLHDFGHPVIWLALDPKNSQTMYASVIHSTKGGIYVTHNLGAGSAAIWTKLTNPPRTQGHPYNIRVLQDGALVVSYSARLIGPENDSVFTLSSGIFVSTDGGQTWLDRSHPNMRRWTKDVVIDPYDSTQSTWYAAVFSHWNASPNNVGGLYRTNDRGQTWSRIKYLDRVESIAFHPTNPDVGYLTTETDGLWVTNNLHTAAVPTFTAVGDYYFRHPMRVFFNPFNPEEVWVTSYGNGLRVKAGGTAN